MNESETPTNLAVAINLMRAVDEETENNKTPHVSRSLSTFGVSESVSPRYVMWQWRSEQALRL